MRKIQGTFCHFLEPLIGIHSIVYMALIFSLTTVHFSSFPWHKTKYPPTHMCLFLSLQSSSLQKQNYALYFILFVIFIDPWSLQIYCRWPTNNMLQLNMFTFVLKVFFESNFLFHLKYIVTGGWRLGRKALLTQFILKWKIRFYRWPMKCQKLFCSNLCSISMPHYDTW